MPMSPLGGITLFVNLLILIVGFLLRVLVHMGVSLRPLWGFFHRLVGEETNTLTRRALSWSVAVSILLFVFGGTFGVLSAVLEKGTNLELLAETFEYQRAIANEKDDPQGIVPERNERAEVDVPAFSTSSPLFGTSSPKDMATAAQ